MSSSASPVPSPLTANNASPSWTRVLLSSLSALQGILFNLSTFLVYITGYLIRALAWTLSGLYAAAAWPLSRLLNFARFALSPITCTIAYAFAPITYIFRFVRQFQPLYTFLGSAAVVGAVVGLVVALVSNYFVSALQLGPESEQESSTESEEEWTPHSIKPAASSQASAKSPAGGRVPPRDDVWLWLEDFKPHQPDAGTPENVSAVRLSTKQKRYPSGLLSRPVVEKSSAD
ncbi:hypothetical protein CMQ_6046 [Grosmannia clavigera kw1407]|uniref:Uncharacterized protein n=1 Tax=Grosmannia clavigera (strain kw1407 / UAMH 11150) TaxID=655863 RepID=F0XLU3_GROCL|nr:uncharacterized protein CMQ_6046 [Grosmannia clavigera kw1407]EFX01104.1 hypothetical protein CMQ_6046 [Grosmannia clavigera kw1407]